MSPEKISERFIEKKLALFGGIPIRSKPFPDYPIIGEDDKQAVLAVLNRGKLSTFGAGPKGNFAGGIEVQEFEKFFASFNESKHAICVNSATAGLHCALAAVGVGPGDEVIVPPYTFTATATSVLMHNAIPVFCDIEDQTFTLDPKKITQLITPKTKAIIPVHLCGHPADMDAIMQIAKKHNLFVIEDCAQAVGAEYKGIKVGNLGHFGVFSFQETKNLPVGEGGMITTNDELFAERCGMIRNHGESILFGKPRSYISNIIGWNYRMTELEAALGKSQLAKLEGFTQQRRDLFEHLREKLSGLPGLQVPFIADYVKHAYHIFAMRYDAGVTGVKREILIKALGAEGIPVAPGYKRPLYENPIFMDKKAYGEQGCPFTCPYYGRDIDYTKSKCETTEELVQLKALWIFTARPPATLQDMQDIVFAFEKVFSNMEELKGYHDGD